MHSRKQNASAQRMKLVMEFLPPRSWFIPEIGNVAPNLRSGKNIVVLPVFTASASILFHAAEGFSPKCLGLSREKYRYS
jgi:hypothetical protein